MKKLILVLAILLMGVLSLPAIEADGLSGAWTLTMQTPRGERSHQMVFRLEGEKLTVTSTNPRGEPVTGQGTFKNGDIEWTMVRQTPRGEMSITYKGKLQGQTLSGTANGPMGGPMNWTAVRAAQ